MMVIFVQWIRLADFAFLISFNWVFKRRACHVTFQLCRYLLAYLVNIWCVRILCEVCIRFCLFKLSVIYACVSFIPSWLLSGCLRGVQLKIHNVTWCQEWLRSIAFLHSLPAPHSLEINDSNVAEKWSEWKEIGEHYIATSKVNKEEGDVQVAVFLTTIGPEARKVFKTWNLLATERKDIKGVIERFNNYCNPRKNIPFERYVYNSRQQEPGESFDRYVTALRQIADKCAVGAITPDDRLRERIILA